MVMITPYFIKTKGYDVIGVNVFLRKFAKICYDLKAPNAIGTMTTRFALYAVQISEERNHLGEVFVDDAFVQRSHKSGKKWKITFYSHSKPKDKNSKDKVGVETKTFD